MLVDICSWAVRVHTIPLFGSSNPVRQLGRQIEKTATPADAVITSDVSDYVSIDYSTVLQKGYVGMRIERWFSMASPKARREGDIVRRLHIDDKHIRIRHM